MTCSNKACTHYRGECQVIKNHQNRTGYCERTDCLYNTFGSCYLPEASFRNLDDTGHCNEFKEKCDVLKQVDINDIATITQIRDDLVSLLPENAYPLVRVCERLNCLFNTNGFCRNLYAYRANVHSVDCTYFEDADGDEDMIERDQSK